MDETDFSDDKIDTQQEDAPNDGGIPSNNDVLEVSDQVIFTVDPQGKVVQQKTHRNADTPILPDQMTENAAHTKDNGEKQCTIILHIPPRKEKTSKSNISEILLNHLSKEEFLKGPGIDGETFPEITNADNLEEAVIKNVILCYVKNSWSNEQSPEHDEQLNPQGDGEDHGKPRCPPITAEGNLSDFKEPVVAGRSSIQGNVKSPATTESPNANQKTVQGLTPQKQQSEKSSSGNGFKCGQGQVHYRLPDFSKVAPRVKIPKKNIFNKPLTVSKQTVSSLTLKDKPSFVQDLFESMPTSKCVEKQHQAREREIVGPSQQAQVGPTAPIHQDHLTGVESETALSKLSSTSQEGSSSSSYIFQKISKGKQMCQKLKEETEQLEAKVHDFSKRITQDSSYSSNRRPVLEKLQGHLELLEQEFLATKEKHLTWQQQSYKHKSPAVGDFDPERKVEGEIFKLEMLLEGVKEKTDEHKYTSPPSLPAGSPIILDDLLCTSPPPSNEIPKDHPGYPPALPGTRRSEGTGVAKPGLSEELGKLDLQSSVDWLISDVAAQDLPDQTPTRLSSVSREEPSRAAGGQERAETTPAAPPSPSCAFCHRALERRQKMERRGHRRIHSGRFSIIIRENPLHLCSSCSSDAGDSSCSDSGMGLQRNKCENCGANTPPSRRVSREAPPKAYSKLTGINSQRTDVKFPQDEHEPTPENRDLQVLPSYRAEEPAPSPCAQDWRGYGSKSFCDFQRVDKMEFETLNSALDHALRTATVLKKTTDQMIKSIAEDLDKVRRQRIRLQY
ncbi:protein AKNAD1 [Echinops telfairi]|uniref:Protein AKNAD1 n=1 Tax=Echinops telfairi TaxID=9371 RepID=A0AC55D881_ECHTE|nr:protein AKNAD1 [Echinops telfairi]